MERAKERISPIRMVIPLRTIPSAKSWPGSEHARKDRLRPVARRRRIRLVYLIAGIKIIVVDICGRVETDDPDTDQDKPSPEDRSILRRQESPAETEIRDMVKDQGRVEMK